MRKKLTCLLVLVLLLLCVGCSAGPSSLPYSCQAVIDGQTVTITYNTSYDGTVEAENGTYTFIYDEDNTFHLAYPDGSLFSRKKLDKDGNYAVPPEYNASQMEAKGYLDGFSVAEGIEDTWYSIEQEYGNKPTLFLVGLLIIVGIWHLFWPQNAWKYTQAWLVREKKSPEAAIRTYRITGALCIVAGIICFIVYIVK